MRTKHSLYKAAAAGIAAAGLAVSMAACGSSDDSGAKGQSGSDAGSGEAIACPAEGGKVYYLNFKPEQAEDWVSLAAKYTEETGIPVEVQTAASGTYETTLMSEMSKSDAPTLFQVNGPVGQAAWADYLSDLSDTEAYQNLVDPSMALTDADGKPVAVPYVIETYGLIYNKALLNKYLATDGAVVSSVDEINNFDTLKKVADDIQAKKDELGIDGAFTSAGFDPSSDWRFKTHLANMPLAAEFVEEGYEGQPESLKGTYLSNYKDIFDLYITDSTTEPTLLSSKTGEDANAEFALGKAVFYQNGTWAYSDIKDQKVADEDLGMLPIYIGAPDEENQGLTTGSENYWVINSEASEVNQAATKCFIDWVITSDEGRDALANTMGFRTPFTTFDDYASDNPLVQADEAYFEAGKTPVAWYFTVMPSEEWKNGVGQSLLEYAQGTGDWDTVQKAFVDGWADEVAVSGGANNG